MKSKGLWRSLSRNSDRKAVLIMSFTRIRSLVALCAVRSRRHRTIPRSYIQPHGRPVKGVPWRDRPICGESPHLLRQDTGRGVRAHFAVPAISARHCECWWNSRSPRNGPVAFAKNRQWRTIRRPTWSRNTTWARKPLSGPVSIAWFWLVQRRIFARTTAFKYVEMTTIDGVQGRHLYLEPKSAEAKDHVRGIDLWIAQPGGYPAE